MIKYIAVALLSLFVFGCGEDKRPYRAQSSDIGVNSGMTTYIVDGVKVNCLWKGRGMSCNWAEHNKMKEIEE